MAKFMSTTSGMGQEPPSTQGASISERFVAFVASLPQMISDDRDLAGHPGWDPAIDPWFTAAERSLGRTKALAASVLVPQPYDAAERALQRVAKLFARAISSACPEEVARMRADAGLRRWAYRVPVRDAHAAWVNGQITKALDSFEDWLSIEDAFAPADTDTDLGPDF
jgi:hypothetical protein